MSSTAYTVTITSWLENAVRDVERRGLPALEPQLRTFARSTSLLRAADWNIDATGKFGKPKDPDAS